jgi:hypothetical protein
MKTIAIIATAMIMFSTSFSFAETNKRTLTVIDSFGRKLTMPVKVEEAAEEIPFDQTEIVRQSRVDHASRVFEISCMSKPESAEEIPAELKVLFGK